MAIDRKTKLEAYKLYMTGMPMAEIARTLGLAPTTVRSWKSREKWDDPDYLHRLHEDTAAKIKTGKKKKKRKEPAEETDDEDAAIREAEAKAAEAMAESAAQRGQRQKKQSDWNWTAAQKDEESAARRALKPLMANDKLNDQQKLFCIYFIKSFNAVASYQRAYGCSYNAALVNGHRLLHQRDVKREIDRLKNERAMAAYLSPEDIIERMLAIAFGDIGDFVDFGKRWEPYVVRGKPVIIEGSDGQPIVSGRDVNYMELKDSTDVDTSLIAEIKQGRDGTSIKLHDRIRALEWLGEHLGLLTPEQRKRMNLVEARTRLLEVETEARETLDVEDLEAIDDEIFPD